MKETNFTVKIRYTVSLTLSVTIVPCSDFISVSKYCCLPSPLYSVYPVLNKSLFLPSGVFKSRKKKLKTVTIYLHLVFFLHYIH